MIKSEEIYSTAEALVRHFGTRNPFEIADGLGVRLINSPQLGRLLGLYKYMLKNRVVILNSELSESQAAMVLAHELGHDRLHFKLAKNGLVDSRLFDISSETEYEANAFAAHLLIDHKSMLEYISVYNYNAFQIASAMNLNSNLVLIKFLEMNRLGYNFTLPFEPDAKFFKNVVPEFECPSAE